MSRELLQQALDALNTCDWDYDYDEESYKTFDEDLVNAAAAALEAELAKPEQEPVAWMLPEYGDVLPASQADGTGIYNIPLYTAPPRKPWVGLTDEERNEMRSIVQGHTKIDAPTYGLTLQYATEEVLKEKNNAV
jgi:hypothetical protein